MSCVIHQCSQFISIFFLENNKKKQKQLDVIDCDITSTCICTITQNIFNRFDNRANNILNNIHTNSCRVDLIIEWFENCDVYRLTGKQSIQKQQQQHFYIQRIYREHSSGKHIIIILQVIYYTSVYRHQQSYVNFFYYYYQYIYTYLYSKYTEVCVYIIDPTHIYLILPFMCVYIEFLLFKTSGYMMVGKN